VGIDGAPSTAAGLELTPDNSVQLLGGIVEEAGQVRLDLGESGLTDRLGDSPVDGPCRLIGDLTIRDVTREVILDVEYAGQAQGPMGNTSAGFTASTRLNRKDWGLTWNMALETGGVLVGEEVKVDIEVELTKQPDPEAEAATATQ